MNSVSTFADLGLSEPLIRALDAAELTRPTPIQAQAIPSLLNGRDVLGIAQTGTGKTAAFGLPLLQLISRRAEGLAKKSVGALILAPTRELAIQIDAELKRFSKFMGIRHALVFGGVGHQPQIRSLEKGVDILVATPGRLLDHLQAGAVRLDAVTHLVLDEADRMLDMGFVRDVMKIVGLMPKARQSLLFSATMPREIADLAAKILKDPVRVEVTPETVTVDRIEQHLFRVPMADKRRLLIHLLNDPAMERVVVFTRTKRGADRVSEHLEKAGIEAEALHGNKSQGARQRALEGFRTGSVRILVATDIAARGIDVSGVTHVVNYEMPVEPESYVHRIGRTGRAGRTGIAYSFCDGGETSHLKAIEKLIRKAIPIAATPIATGEATARSVPESRGTRAPKIAPKQTVKAAEEGDAAPRRSKRNRWRGQQKRRAA